MGGDRCQGQTVFWVFHQKQNGLIDQGPDFPDPVPLGSGRLIMKMGFGPLTDPHAFLLPPKTKTPRLSAYYPTAATMLYLTQNYGIKRQGTRVRKRIFGIKNFSGRFHVTAREELRLLRRIVR